MRTDNELKGHIGQNLASTACYLEPPFKQPSNKIVVAGEQIGNKVTSAGIGPMAGKADRLLFEGQYYYSLLCMLSCPATPDDQEVVHCVKVLCISNTPMKVAYALFGTAGSSDPPAVISKTSFNLLTECKNIMVYLCLLTCCPLPKPGNFWRSRKDKATVQADGAGAQWQPRSTQALSNVLVQFKGRLTKQASSKYPCGQVY